MATTKQRDNRIHRLLDNENCWVDNNDRLCAVDHNYFINLFKAPQTMRSAGTLTFRHQVTRLENETLLSPFLFDEFEVAIK